MAVNKTMIDQEFGEMQVHHLRVGFGHETVQAGA
jgi:hypothetical protein